MSHHSNESWVAATLYNLGSASRSAQYFTSLLLRQKAAQKYTQSSARSSTAYYIDYALYKDAFTLDACSRIQVVSTCIQIQVGHEWLLDCWKLGACRWLYDEAKLLEVDLDTFSSEEREESICGCYMWKEEQLCINDTTL